LSGEKLARAVGKRADEAEEDARKLLIKSGVKMTKGTAAFRAELNKAGAPLTADWIKRVKKLDVDGQAVISMYKSETAKMATKK
jgi:secreted protein with Ig-like and vWFA domain